MNNRLFYDKPASYWEEALPIGNGRLGAMIFGGLDLERIQLNEDTVWSGFLKDDRKTNSPEDFTHVRRLIDEGRYADAKSYIDANMEGDWTESYLTMGDLFLRFSKSGTHRNYQRSLDLTEGICSVSYEKDLNDFRVDFRSIEREIFADYENDVIAMRIFSADGGKISFTAFLDSVIRSSALAEDDYLFLRGRCPSRVEPSYVKCEKPVVYDDTKNTIEFEMAAKFISKGGRRQRHQGKIEIVGADEVLIYITAFSNFISFDKEPERGMDLRKKCVETIENAAAKAYEEIKDRHIKSFSEIMNRVKLNIETDVEKTPLATDELLKKMKAGVDDGSLAALLFNYGRYLLVSSSRGGSQPANLQGIWNHEIRPAWSSNLTTNINTEMNYWHAETANLGEFARPLFKAIEEMSITGEKTARNYFGCGGFCVNHNVDIWRKTSPASGNATHSFWPVAGGWLCRHLWEHYLFSGDEDFLRNSAYDIIKKAAEFFMDWLIEDESGYLVTSPSVSPENIFVAKNGDISSVFKASTMDISIIKECFAALIDASAILGNDSDFIQRVKAAAAKLPPYRIGRHGQLMEWFEDFDEYEPGHRHFSHLYGIYPGSDIAVGQQDELINAARVTLERRLENGGGHTGWSCAWLICTYARFCDGEGVYDFLKMLFKNSTYDNLFNMHPPFQIDGNMGYCAAIAEVLLQSHYENYAIKLLPALPGAWRSGSVSGLRARKGFEVDITWQEGSLKEAKVKSCLGEELEVITAQRLIFSENGALIPAEKTERGYKINTEKCKVYSIIII
ncbi:MAG: glycosyl hydrolase family 95 catalytic domain-containing protein [Christensenellales bacterium]|jgi:alpha-L-fucosidase 2